MFWKHADRPHPLRFLSVRIADQDLSTRTERLRQDPMMPPIPLAAVTAVTIVIRMLLRTPIHVWPMNLWVRITQHTIRMIIASRLGITGRQDRPSVSAPPLQTLPPRYPQI